MTIPPDVPFATLPPVAGNPNYRFKADIGRYAGTDTRVDRDMPTRLGEIINIKDWGAVGDGVTDDGSALIAAFNYAKALNAAVLNAGATIFFPAGTYRIDSSHLPLNFDLYPSGGTVNFRGVGRDASIITANFGSSGNGTYYSTSTFHGTSAPMFYFRNINSPRISDLTVWNQSTSYDATTFVSNGGDGNGIYENCKFIAPRGFVCEEDQFGQGFINCIFMNGSPLLINRADSTTPGPLAGTFGLIWNQGNVLNCRFYGYDTGIGLSSTIYFQAPANDAVGVAQSTSINGCYFYRCIRAITGRASGDQSNHRPVASGSPSGNCPVFNTAIIGNQMERCAYGLGDLNQYIRGSVLCNVVTGTTGQCDPAPVSNVSWNGVNTVTITTPSNHNIGADRNIQLIGIPTGTTTGIVPVHIVDPTHFTYSYNANPVVTSGSWNYPMEDGISSYGVNQGFYAANVLSAWVANVSFDITGKATGQFSSVGKYTTVAATWMPFGFNRPPHNNDAASDINYPTGWIFLQCDAPSSSPVVPFLHCPDLCDTTQELSVTDAASSFNFGDTVGIFLVTTADCPSGTGVLTFASVPSFVTAGIQAFALNFGQSPGIQAGNIVVSKTSTTVTLQNNSVRDTPAGTTILFTAGGGSNHCKVRYNGNWVRVG